MFSGTSLESESAPLFLAHLFKCHAFLRRHIFVSMLLPFAPCVG